MRYRHSWCFSRAVRWWIGISLGFIITGLSSYALAVPAFPGAEGFGTETVHGRGGIVVIVTNTNDSGPGSLRDALLMTQPRIIIFRVSGTIVWKSRLLLKAAHSNVAVYGQTAPGDGITLRGPAADNVMSLSELDGTSDFSDGLFQHLRFRHGVPSQDTASLADNLGLRGGTNNTVFDHNSFTWAGDETVSLWRGDTFDITFSNNIFAEGVVLWRASPHGQNAGPLMSGGSPRWNITFHHNAYVHLGFRAFKLTSGNGGGTRGIQAINNVHYNTNVRDYGFSQQQHTGTTAITIDVISDYFKVGPDNTSARPFTALREAPGTFSPMSLHLQDSTYRNQDGTAHANNDEADNFASGMFGTQAIGGGGEPTYIERATPISPQPVFSVITTTAAQAYTDVIINEDVGAKPTDSVDQRLIDAPENGDAWSTENCPSTASWNGCTASYPTMTTYNVPTDTDSDGVPDYYETNPLGTNPNGFESQAILDHDGDGYSNIEEWVHTLSSGGGSKLEDNRPKPPTLISAN